MNRTFISKTDSLLKSAIPSDSPPEVRPPIPENGENSWERVRAELTEMQQNFESLAADCDKNTPLLYLKIESLRKSFREAILTVEILSRIQGGEVLDKEKELYSARQAVAALKEEMRAFRCQTEDELQALRQDREHARQNEDSLLRQLEELEQKSCEAVRKSAQTRQTFERKAASIQKEAKRWKSQAVEVTQKILLTEQIDRENQRLKQDLEIQKAFLKEQIESVMRESGNWREKAEQSANELKTVEVKLFEMEMAQAEIRKTKEDMESERGRLQEEIRRWKSEMEALSVQIKELQEESTANRNLRQNLEKEKSDLESALKESQAAFQKFTQTNSKSFPKREKLPLLQQQARKWKEEVKQLTYQIKELSEKKYILETEHSTLEHEKGELEVLLSERQEGYQQFRLEYRLACEEIEVELNKARQEAGDWKKQFQILKQQFDVLAAEKREAEVAQQATSLQKREIEEAWEIKRIEYEKLYQENEFFRESMLSQFYKIRHEVEDWKTEKETLLKHLSQARSEKDQAEAARLQMTQSQEELAAQLAETAQQIEKWKNQAVELADRMLCLNDKWMKLRSEALYWKKYSKGLEIKVEILGREKHKTESELILEKAESAKWKEKFHQILGDLNQLSTNYQGENRVKPSVAIIQNEELEILKIKCKKLEEDLFSGRKVFVTKVIEMSEEIENWKRAALQTPSVEFKKNNEQNQCIENQNSEDLKNSAVRNGSQDAIPSRPVSADTDRQEDILGELRRIEALVFKKKNL